MFGSYYIKNKKIKIKFLLFIYALLICALFILTLLYNIQKNYKILLLTKPKHNNYLNTKKVIV